ncbi:hypothetical protein DVH24_019726 [Malus domestica]|uniref:Uncharacterized protein n=1 Tax=Malus domestica TaxID=3750 RepID=A0A498HYZ7_MALDO|nr:hypothetical protein DVH24_019726 [Malus domestica]
MIFVSNFAFYRKVPFFLASEASASIFPLPSVFWICRDGKSNKKGMRKRWLEICSRNLYLFIGWMKKVRKGNVNNKVVGSCDTIASLP